MKKYADAEQKCGTPIWQNQRAAENYQGGSDIARNIANNTIEQ